MLLFFLNYLWKFEHFAVFNAVSQPAQKRPSITIFLNLMYFNDEHTHFLHLSQLYMLSPEHRASRNRSLNSKWSRISREQRISVPLSSSAAKKAARQSSKVTMGPQNQVGIHETTNLWKDRISEH